MATTTDTLQKSCKEALSKLEKLGDGKYTELREKLTWCLGSYEHDQNPSGLVEYGQKALTELKKIKKDQPKKISQKLIDDLSKALTKAKG